MLVIFSSTAYGDITMFARDAKHLLKLMGQTGNIPGGVLAEDVPTVLARLQKAVTAEQSSENDEEPVVDEASGEVPPVGISARAYPLIEMLKAAAEAETSIMWRQK